MLVRYEIMTTTKDVIEADVLGDMILNLVENELGYECAIDVINAETEQLIDEVVVE